MGLGIAAKGTGTLRHGLRLVVQLSLDSWRTSRLLTGGEAALSALEGVLPAAALWLSRGLVNTLQAELPLRQATDLLPLAPWVGGLAVIALLGSAAATLSSYARATLRPQLGLRLEKRLLAAAASLPLIHFEQSGLYDHLQRARDALGYRLTNMLQFLTQIAQAAVTLVAYFVVLWLADPWLALVVALPAIPSVVLKVRASVSGYVHDWDATPARRLMVYVRDLLLKPSPQQEVRLFGLFGLLRGRWDHAQADWRSEAATKARTETTAAVGTSLARMCAYGVAVVLLVDLIAHNRLTLGDYVVLTGAAAAFQGKLESLLTETRDLLQDLPLLGDLGAFLQLADDAEARSGVEPFPQPLRAGLRLAGVRFRYPGGSEVLAGVDFAIRPGETVAIVGANGAGKSTLIKLILGLYEPNSGRITYDGVDVQAIAPESLARNAAAVFQDFARFRRPLREALAPGDPELQRDEMRLHGALAAAGLAERADRFPRGLDTMLDPSMADDGEGADLSGGEWQKLAIARALARDAQLLVLDEPTASLDPEAELAVYRQFAALAKGRMTFLISHRIGSARIADRILVLAGGRIVEEGRHSELIERDGLYRRMFEAQARWYRKEAGDETPA